jgi:transposase-like protein
VRNVGFRDKTNNNQIERFHGTFKERDKVMKVLDSEESAENVIDGFRIYYNLLRPHMTLNEKTPVEKAGIVLKLEGNRWLQLR